ncbi:uncharacterized protein LOC115663116 [Syzygium oleosum]|uniref:uncharacterized protein LOC115663116 n=1 Tax=Syzygium oleosum TaxID=219896 RepID=UPI0024BA66FA|nr:uncharacterized protein LOC115663116 [Syzygium oleosum]
MDVEVPLHPSARSIVPLPPAVDSVAGPDPVRIDLINSKNLETGPSSSPSRCPASSLVQQILDFSPVPCSAGPGVSKTAPGLPLDMNSGGVVPLAHSLHPAHDQDSLRPVLNFLEGPNAVTLPLAASGPQGRFQQQLEDFDINSHTSTADSASSHAGGENSDSEELLEGELNIISPPTTRSRTLASLIAEDPSKASLGSIPSMSCLDHSPMVVKILSPLNSKKPFKFYNFWTSHPNFLDLVKQAWDTQKLKQLNRSFFSDISTRTDQLRSDLYAVQAALEQHPFDQRLQDREAELTRSFSTMRMQEESFYRQKSLTEPQAVRAHIVNHFQELLNGASASTWPSVSEIGMFLGRVLDENQWNLLALPVTDEEIWSTLFSLAKGKAPGPDGYNIDFFKSSWEIIGPSTLVAVRDFFESGCMLKEINNTILTLVPKSPNASAMSDFRPIACCNTLYKCISKILARRIVRILPTLIGPAQTAFVKGRRISDNILIAQELFADFHHRPYLSKCAIKVDFQKAYDTVDWSFLEKALMAFKFPVSFTKLVMACVTTAKFSVSINGELHGYFGSSRGIRQGDPLSPYLFILVMEIFSGILKAKTDMPDFHWFWRCKKTRLSHLFFADDVLLFAEGHLRSVQLINESLLLFSDWSGLKPNKAKSNIFITGGTQALHDQLIQCLGFQQGPDLGVGGAKVAWKAVCLPKEEGGLGIWRLVEYNNAMTLKHIWLLFTDKESLWCKWIHSTFLKKANFWLVPKPTFCSWTWKKILDMRLSAQAMFRWKIGNGRSVSFWFDWWHSRGPLYLLFSNAEIYQSRIPRDATVRSFYEGS